LTDGQGHNESRCVPCPNPHPPTKCEVGPALPGYLCAVLKAMVHGFLHRILSSYNDQKVKFLSSPFNAPTLQNPDQEPSDLRSQEVRDNCQKVTVAVGQAIMNLPPEPSTTWSSSVDRGSTHVGGTASGAQIYVSELSASLHHGITHSRENPSALLKPGIYRWHIQIVSGTFQTPCACGTDLSYATFSSSIGGSMEKSPKFLQA
jgi:hypothetical protein